MPMFWGATTDGKRVFEVIKGLKRHSHKSGSTGVQVQWFWSKPSTILFYQTPHQRSFYSPRDYFNRCSPVMSHMVNLSCRTSSVSSLESHWMVQIYHVRMYGPICTCLSILLCICPVQLHYEVAFTIRSTNGLFLPKQAVEHVGQSI